jgi:hypothetical protein
MCHKFQYFLSNHGCLVKLHNILIYIASINKYLSQKPLSLIIFQKGTVDSATHLFPNTVLCRISGRASSFRFSFFSMYGTTNQSGPRSLIFRVSELRFTHFWLDSLDGLSASRKASTYTGQHKHRKDTDI